MNYGKPPVFFESDEIPSIVENTEDSNTENQKFSSTGQNHSSNNSSANNKTEDGDGDG